MKTYADIDVAAHEALEHEAVIGRKQDPKVIVRPTLGRSSSNQGLWNGSWDATAPLSHFCGYRGSRGVKLVRE